MGTYFQDVRYAARMLKKNPSTTAIVVITLALGIGANTAIFSVVKAVLFSPLPYSHAQELVELSDHFKAIQGNAISYLEAEDLRRQSKTIDKIALFHQFVSNLTGGDTPARVSELAVSYNFFDVLEAKPLLGRTLNAGDELPGFGYTQVLSYELWQRRFGGDPHIIGRKIKIDDDEMTIVGVMPPNFADPNFVPVNGVESWVPSGFRATPYNPPLRTDRFLTALVRLKPGVSVAQAQAEMDTIAARFQQQYPKDYPADSGWRMNVRPWQERIVGNNKNLLLVLLGSVGFVLLITCANVINLLLARTNVRSKEIAIRSALGAGRARILRQILTENVMVFLIGGAVGLLLSVWGVKLLVTLVHASIPRADRAAIDGTVLLFNLAVSLVAGVICGLVPGMQMSNAGGTSLKECGTKSTVGRSGNRARNILVISEYALALILLTGAGLLLRTFVGLLNVSPGFDSKNVLTAAIWLPSPNEPQHGRFFTLEQQHFFYKTLLERISSVPGVTAATTSRLPISDTFGGLPFELDGKEIQDVAQAPVAELALITPRYFDVLKIEQMQGRAFADTDEVGKPLVFIVNRALANQYWPGESPLNKRLKILGRTTTSEWGTVVGVVGDVKTLGLNQDVKPQIYMPLMQSANWINNLSCRLLIRSSGSTAGLREKLVQAVSSIDPEEPVANIRPMDEVLAVSIAQQRFSLMLVAAFAGLGLVLAFIGIYGLLTFLVSERTKEIGIRMAIGAQRMDVLRLIMAQGMGLASVGIAIGVAGSLVLTRMVKGLLFHVSATDPLTFTCVALLLLLASLMASFVPARRAMKMDPMLALRYE